MRSAAVEGLVSISAPTIQTLRFLAFSHLLLVLSELLNHRVAWLNESCLSKTRVQIWSCWCLSQWAGINEFFFISAIYLGNTSESRSSSVVFLFVDNLSCNYSFPAKHNHLLILWVLLKSTLKQASIFFTRASVRHLQCGPSTVW